MYYFYVIIEEFWIAEKFIKGDFIKYNNNNGYILN